MAKKQTPPEQPPIIDISVGTRLEISEEVAQGTYVNLAMISHSEDEFVIDFATSMPGAPSAKIKSRIIMSPSHARRLLSALEMNVSRFDVEQSEKSKKPSRTEVN